MLPKEPFWTVRGDDWTVEYFFKKPNAAARLEEQKAAGKRCKMKRVEVWKVFSEVKGD